MTVALTNPAGYDITPPNRTVTLHRGAEAAPTITSADNTSVAHGSGGTFAVAATGTTPITFALSGQPAGVSIDSATGVISIATGTAIGTHSFIIIATNAEGTASQNFTLTVAATQFTVTFNGNGGTPSHPYAIVDAGGTFGGFLPWATRPGFTFIGWNTQPNGSGAWFTGTTVVNASLTVFAQWLQFAGDDHQADEPDDEPVDWRVHAQIPRISAQPQFITVYASQQAALSVDAYVTDGGSLTFQWYRADGARGGSFRPIPGATGSTLIPNTSTIGINHYRVAITNTNNAPWITGNRTARTISRAVTVGVIAPAPAPTPPPTPSPLTVEEWQNPFTDVSESDWFFEFVRFAHINNLFSGTSATTFSPNTPMTKGMLVTVLYRMAGAPDAPGDTWYANAVSWGTENGITSGIGDSHFAPDQDITREQTALMLYNYARHMDLTLPTIRTGAFADNTQINAQAHQAVTAMFEAGIINGRGGGYFDPQSGATRAEVATMLRNFMEAT